MREGEPSRKQPERGDGLRSPLREVAPGRYVEFELTGEGGMGLVYWAIDTELNRQIAFKIVRPDAATGEPAQPPDTPFEAPSPGRDTDASHAFETLTARFLQEAWITGGMEHPGIVPVYELGKTAEDVPYYTMRFVRGRRTLASAIREAEGGTFEDRLQLLDPYLRLCDTIAYAHANGVIHRDIKPENVALGDFGEVVVLDWGLAKLEGAPDRAADLWQHQVQALRDARDLHTVAGAMGTPGYMAPESVRGEIDTVDAQSDVYSLGAVLFEVLTGRLPFPLTGSFLEYASAMLQGSMPTVRFVEPAVPEALEAICLSALARTKDQRTPSAAELAAAIRAWQAQSALAREVDALRRETDEAIGDAEQAFGADRLAEVERASGRVEQIRRLTGDTVDALVARIDALRKRGVTEAQQRARRRLLIRGGVVLLALGLVVSLVVSGYVADQRDRAVRAEKTTRRALRSARAGGLANAAIAAGGRDHMRSLLLATAAAELEPTRLSIRALHAAVAGSRERRVYRGRSARFSPSGRRIIVTASLEDVAQRIYNPDGTDLLAFLGEGEATAVALSSDEARLATAVGDVISIWALDGDRVVEPAAAVMRGHEGIVGTLSFSPDGSRLLSTGVDGTARLWDPAAGERGRFRPKLVTESPDFEAVFSPTGKHVLVTSSGACWILDGETLASTPVARQPWIGGGGFLPDGSAVVLGTEHGVHVVDLQGRSIRSHTLRRPSTFVRPSPVDDRVLVGFVDGTAEVLSMRDGTGVQLRGHDDVGWAGTFSPDGTLVLTASDDQTARLWDTFAGRALGVLRGHSGTVFTAAFAPDGLHVLTSATDETTRLWSVFGGEQPVFQCPRNVRGRYVRERDLVLRLRADDGLDVIAIDGSVEASLPIGRIEQMPGVRRSADGSRYATLYLDGRVELWRRDGTHIATIRDDTERREEAVFSPDGRWLVTCDTAGGVDLRDRDGKHERALVDRVEDYVVAQVAFSPDGSTLAVGRGKQVLLVDLGTGRPRTLLEGRRYDVLRFSPDGSRLLLAGEHDGFVELRDLDGTQRLETNPGQGSIRTAVFSPDGGRIVTAAAWRDHFMYIDIPSATTAHLWDGEGRHLAELGGHDDEVLDAAFAPDGTRFATVSSDATLRLWDREGGELGVIDSPDGPLTSVRFLDSDTLLTASRSGALRTWILDPDRLLALARSRATRPLTEWERKTYATLLDAD